MAEINKELLDKAKQANSPKELLVLAKEIDVELTQKQAEAFFKQTNESNELPDDELDNVAGGTACDYRGRPIVDGDDSCELWVCRECGWHYNPSFGVFFEHSNYCSEDETCRGCLYCRLEGNLRYCENPKKQVFGEPPHATQWR